jgi:hypothetical protein
MIIQEQDMACNYMPRSTAALIHVLSFDTIIPFCQAKVS